MSTLTMSICLRVCNLNNILVVGNCSSASDDVESTS